MTIVAIPPIVYPPSVPGVMVVSTSFNGVAQAFGTIDAANEQMTVDFQMPVSGNLEAVSMRTQTVSVTAGPLNFDFRIESISGGLPSGALFGTNTNAAVSVATTDDNVWKTATLTAAAAVTKGDKVAFVIKAPAAGTFSLTWGGHLWSLNSALFPVGRVDGVPDGTYSTLMTGKPSFAIKVDGVWMAVPPFAAVDTMTLTTFNNASAPDEYLSTLRPKTNMRVAGIVAGLVNVTAGADFTCSLWSGSSAAGAVDADALAQVAISGNAIGTVTQDGYGLFLFPTAVPITAGVNYWIGVRADTANNMQMIQLGCGNSPAPSDTSCLPGGSDAICGFRTWTAGVGGTITTQAQQQCLISAWIDGLDVAADSTPQLMGQAVL